jgi:Right handed beta helix region
MVNPNGDGLFVRDGVRLTVNNKTLQGSGTGAGVTLLGDGARVISGTGNTASTIQGFAIGVSGTGDSLQVLSLNVINNLNEGIKITGNLSTISSNKVFLNGLNGGSTINVSGDRSTVRLNSVGDEFLGNHDDGIVVVATGNPSLPASATVNNLIEQNTVPANGADAIVVSGNRNAIRGNQVGDLERGNGGHGIVVQGKRNVINDHNSVFANGLNGILVQDAQDANAQDANGNRIAINSMGDKDKGNGGDGIQVVGAQNLLMKENKIFANHGDGIEVRGGIASVGPNLFIKNVIGDRGKGNTLNGIYIHDVSGNAIPNPVELDSNVVKSNGRNGILIDAGATGHELKRNSSGGSGDQANGRCAYFVVPGNFNATGNSANGKGVNGADGTPSHQAQSQRDAFRGGALLLC